MESTAEPHRSLRPALLAIGAAAILAVLIRLPLFRLPLDPDEGGYAYLASRWAAGARLYSLPPGSTGRRG